MEDRHIIIDDFNSVFGIKVGIYIFFPYLALICNWSILNKKKFSKSNLLLLILF